MKNKIAINQPKFAWHYTSPEGLLGILSKKEFYVSNAKFLNDPSEINYSNEVLFEALKKYESLSQYESLTKEIFVESFKIDKYQYYTLSLSSDKDSLSMWNYYGNNGYAIKINISNLFKYGIVKEIPIDSERENESSISEVIYNREKQVDFLRQQFDVIFSNSTNKSDVTQMNINFFCEKYNTSRLYLKNTAYSHEKEFRCLYKINQEDANLINKYRLSKKGTIVPYIIVDISEDIEKIISEIKLHPLMNEDVTMYGLELFLKSNNLNKIKISASNIPYREM